MCLGTFLGMEASWHGKSCFTAGFLSRVSACKLLLGVVPGMSEQTTVRNHLERTSWPSPKAQGCPDRTSVTGFGCSPRNCSVHQGKCSQGHAYLCLPRGCRTWVKAVSTSVSCRGFHPVLNTFICTGAADKGSFKGTQRGNHLKAELW